MNGKKLKSYYQLTKPGIIYGNAITAAAGFLLASHWHINGLLLIATLAGLSFVIASACVFNNYLDRNIDHKMARTKNRALVTKMISTRSAILYASFLGILGVAILTFYTNLLTLGVALIGFFFYVVVYGIGKRKTVYGTVIGSISGAVPPVVGYCAVSNRFDTGALILFLILVLWQMPHFYAIAIYRLQDYKGAALPVLPVKKGIYITKLHMLFYILAFLITSLLLTLLGYTGYVYFALAALLGLTWLGYCLYGFTTENDARWARKMFILSLVIIVILCLIMSVDARVPRS